MPPLTKWLPSTLEALGLTPTPNKPGIVVQANSEVEAGESDVQGHSPLHSQYKFSLGYTVDSMLKQTNKLKLIFVLY